MYPHCQNVALPLVTRIAGVLVYTLAGSKVKGDEFPYRGTDLAVYA